MKSEGPVPPQAPPKMTPMAMMLEYSKAIFPHRPEPDSHSFLEISVADLGGFLRFHGTSLLGWT